MTEPHANGEAEGLDGIGGPSRLRAFLLYGTMVLGAVSLFLLIDACGAKLVAPELTTPAAEGAAPVGGKPDALVHVRVDVDQGAAAGRAGRMTSPPPPETVYYQDDRVLVTSVRVVLEGRTLAVSVIRSAAVAEVCQDQTGVVLSIIGVVLCVCTLGLSLILVGVGVVLMWTAPTAYAVQLRGPFGTPCFLPCADRAYVLKVCQAISRAVNAAGGQGRYPAP
jgi:hypothetical protein